MALKNKSSFCESIHSQALDVAQKYKKSELELIEILEKIDHHKIYYKYGYSSLFKYINQGLKLSVEVTAIFINVSRKTRELPKLRQEIKNGNITISKARRMTSVINEKNQDHWLNLAKTSTKQNLEKAVAAHNPKEAVRDQLKYINKDFEVCDRARLMKLDSPGEVTSKVRVHLQTGISEELMLKIRRVQDLVSEKLRRPADLEDTLEAMAHNYLQRKDPLEIAKRQKLRGKLNNEPREKNFKQSSPSIGAANSKQSSSCPGTTMIANPTRRASIPSAIKHKLNLMHQGRCAYIDKNGQRCQQRHFLEMHHIKPVSNGGNNELINLTLLCSGHHRAHHFNAAVL